MSRSSRLLGLGAAAAVVVPLTLVAPASVAAPSEADLNPSVAAGDWLADQVVVGTGEQADQGFLTSIYNPAPGYDFGLAADAIVSFFIDGTHADTRALLTAGLESNLDAYIRPALTEEGETGTYLDAGRTAKVVLAAATADSAGDFGGQNPTQVLESTVQSNGRAVNQGGSQQGKTTVFAQTYAVEALSRVGSSATDAAVDALLAAQCSDGGFPFTFDGETCVSDVDTTARAVIALEEAGVSDETLLAEADQGVAWLLGAQAPDGSYGSEFEGVVYTSVSSTLLASEAISLAGDSDAASRAAVRAAGFARSLQLDSTTATGDLAAEAGAILPDQFTYDGVVAAGSFSPFDRTGAIFAAAQSYRALALLDGTTQFADTPTVATFFAEIAWLSQQGITTGYANLDGSTSFRGSDAVLREQMAAFLYRYQNDGANPPSNAPNATFSDARTNTFTKHIAWLASEGITTGYADNTFRPSAPVLREQMAAFLYRLAGEPDFTPPATSPFADVPTNATFYKQVTWLAEQGVTTGYEETNGTTTFRGSQPVLREQMAAFLYRFDTLQSQR